MMFANPVTPEKRSACTPVMDLTPTKVVPSASVSPLHKDIRSCCLLCDRNFAVSGKARAHLVFGRTYAADEIQKQILSLFNENVDLPHLQPSRICQTCKSALRCILTEQEAHRLVWNRTVNRRGGPGHRVELDFHMENTVKMMKQALKHLGVNLNERSADIEAKALNELVLLVDSMNKDLCVSKPSGYHKKKHSQADIDKCAKVLLESHMFEYAEGRAYESFPNMKDKLLASLDVKNLKSWMRGHIAKYKYEAKKREQALF